MVTAVSAGTCVPAFAATVDADDAVLSREALAIQAMSDTEFDEFIVNYVNDGENSNKSVQEMQDELQQLGVTFQGESGDISTCALSTGYFDSEVYAVKRGGDAYYRVFGQVLFKAHEEDPAIEDILTVEWDPSQVSFYSYNSSDYVNLRESQVDNGMIIFNVDDSLVPANQYVYGVAYLIPNENLSFMDIGSAFRHTYNDNTYTWSGSLTLGYNNHVTGSGTLTVTAAQEGLTFPLYAMDVIEL